MPRLHDASASARVRADVPAPREPDPPPLPDALQALIPRPDDRPLASLLPQPRPLTLLWDPDLAPTRRAREAALAVQEQARVQEHSRHEPAPQRSQFSETAVQVSVVGGMARAGLDLSRILKKYPEAYRAGRLDVAVAQTLKNAPDTRLIDPEAPPVATAASGGKSFTKWDARLYRMSIMGGGVLAALQFASALPNLSEALNQNGVAGLVNTKSGRSGAFNLFGGGFALTMLGGSILATRNKGTRGFMNVILEASASPRLSRPIVANLFLGAGMVMLFNEAGGMDFLDQNPTKDARESALGVLNQLPIIGGLVPD